MWEEIKKYTDSKTPVLIEFYTADCAPCKMLGAILDNIQEELGDQINVKKVDIDQDKITTINFDSTYQIMGTPSMMLFKEGQLLWKHAGVLFKDDLLKKLEPHL